MTVRQAPAKRQGTPVIRNTAKAVVIADGAVLLARSHWAGQDCYLLPGGGQQPGEPLSATVVREVREETGVDATVEELLWVREYIGANHEHADLELHTHRVECIFRCSVADPAQARQARLGDLPDDVQRGVEWVDLACIREVNLLPQGLRGPIAALQTPAPALAGRPVYLGDIP